MAQATLTATETEQVRDLRARLNRVPEGPLGDKSVGPLSKGFFDVCARVGLTPTAAGSVLEAPEAILAAAEDADFDGLRALVWALQSKRTADAANWRRWMDRGVLQAVLTRRLILAGRETRS